MSFVDREEVSEKKPARKFFKSPDRAARDEAVTALKAKIKEVDHKITKLSDQINGVKIDDSKNEEKKKLHDELKAVIKTQAEIKAQRAKVNDKVKVIEVGLKKKIADLNAQNAKSKFKSVAEIDSQIKKLDDDISTGALKIFEERRNVKEITALRKLKKDFSGIAAVQKSVDEDKAKIADLKKNVSGAATKEIQTKFETITKQLDEIKGLTKGASDKKKTLYDQKRALQGDKDKLYDEMREVNAKYNEAFDKFKADIAAEKVRIEKEEQEFAKEEAKTARERKLKEDLELASRPAFSDEIAAIKVLIKHFSRVIGKDVPEEITADEEKENKPVADKTFNQSASEARKVEAPENYVVFKKKEEVFFKGASGKKGKKGKSAGSNEKFTLEPDVIVQISEQGLEVPTSKEAVPGLIESLLKKFTDYKANQEQATKDNIESAKAKLATLEI